MTQQLAMQMEVMPKAGPVVAKPKQKHKAQTYWQEASDADHCAKCGVARSVFTLHKGKLYCPGTKWGRPSCAPADG